MLGSSTIMIHDDSDEMLGSSTMMIHDDSDVHDDDRDINVAPTFLGPVSFLQ